MRSATVRTSADPGDVCAQNGLIWAVSKMIAEELPAEQNGGSRAARSSSGNDVA